MAPRPAPPRPAVSAKPPSPAWWRNPDVRAVIYQALALLLVLLVGAYLVSITLHNLQVRGIRSGFGYLENEAGFRIGETLIPYAASDSYGRAILVGLLNTLRVAVVGIVLATIIGTLIGIARLSRNWLVAKMASGYVEIVRNMPLLLQLFFWYSAITGLLPAVSAAIEVIPGVYLSKSGLMYPVPEPSPAHGWMTGAFVLAVVASVFYARWARRRQEATGERPPVLRVVLALVVGLVALAWLAGGAPTALDVPTRGRFTYTGGASVSPEFLALLLGLTIYTAGFIAEIVRSGILAVPWGQTEAAASLGLRRGLVLRLVVLPQALRVIVPPMTSQYLNLTKNSSLAVAIGYPDLVSVTNTTLNQTGQAIEGISIMMGIYLTISLSISAFMNWYNRRVALVER
ncbi:MAG: amino acid ABC transporter permease [Alphaproteobacteria bacterium]